MTIKDHIQELKITAFKWLLIHAYKLHLKSAASYFLIRFRFACANRSPERIRQMEERLLRGGHE